MPVGSNVNMEPMVFAGYISLHRWHLLVEDRPFVGLDNFARLLADPFFRNAIGNTFIYVVFSVPLGVLTSLAVAALVAQRLRGVGLFRTLFFIPAVSSKVALAMVAIWILLPEVGLINSALGSLGLDNTTNFLAEPGWAMAALIKPPIFTSPEAVPRSEGSANSLTEAKTSGTAPMPSPTKKHIG